MSTPRASAARGGFRPGRVATVVAIWFGLAVAIDAAFAAAGFVDALVLVFLAALVVLATPRAIGLWRGTVSHTEITHAFRSYSIESWQAFTPSGVIAMDGIAVSFAVLVTTNGEGAVAGAIGLAGGVVFVVFMLGGLTAALVRRPSFLLPATMRPGRSA